jgi:hypothetical protein
MFKTSESTTLRNWDYLVAAVLVVIALYVGSGALSPVDFDKERIEVWALRGHIQVCGLYHYRNRSLVPASLSLGLPFPVDPEHDRPTVFSITEIAQDGTSGKEIFPRLRHGQTVFRLFFGAREDRWVRVDYFQRVRSPSGTYMLLTTRKWGHPLDRGDYILHLGRELFLESSNYLLQPYTSTLPGSYAFSRTNFYPTQDWNFTWRTPAAEPVVARDQR